MRRIPTVEDLNDVLTVVAKKSVKFPIYEDIYEDSIKGLPVGEREMNGLKRAHIETIGDLVNAWDRLSKIRNVGAKTVAKIRYATCQYVFESLTDNRKTIYLQRIIDLNQKGA